MSNANKKPPPLYAPASPAICPVCGHPSYSSAGIHPQCAMLAADQIRVNRINARKNPAATPAEPGLRQFEKRCPQCQAVHPARRFKCGCGHLFQPVQHKTF